MATIKNKTSLILTLIIIAFMIITYSSCKKNDLATNNYTIELKGKPDPEKARQNALAQIQKLGGVPQQFEVNKPVQFYWIDKNKNKVNPTAQNLVSACNYDYPAYCNLIQYARIFECGIGSSGNYRISYKYRLSWNNNIIPVNTLFGMETVGTIWVTDIATGNVDFNTTATVNVSNIVDAGPDPNNPGNNIFVVNFISDASNLIPGFYLEGNTHEVKVNAQFTTDCTNGDVGFSLWTLPVSIFGYSNASTNSPCERNDKVFIRPAGLGGTGSNFVDVVSFGSGCYTSPIIAPHLSEMQYDIDGDENWQPMNVTLSPTYPFYLTLRYFPSDGYGVSGGLPSGTHWIGVRYKNWRFNNPTSLGNATPNSGNACAYSGTGAVQNSGYTYEYFKCIIP